MSLAIGNVRHMKIEKTILYGNTYLETYVWKRMTENLYLETHVWKHDNYSGTKNQIYFLKSVSRKICESAFFLSEHKATLQ